MDRRENNRPTALTEIRAWLVAAFAFLAQLTGLIYWAASLSGDVATIKQQLFVTIEKRLDDHENQIKLLRSEVSGLKIHVEYINTLKTTKSR